MSPSDTKQKMSAESNRQDVDGENPVEPNETDALLEKKEAVSTANPIRWLYNLQKHFGFKLLALLFITQHLLKGFVMSLAGQAEPYLMRKYGVPAPQMQIYSGITQLPWALKPIIGLISDVFPIMGYNKAPYLVIVSCFGTVAYLLIGLMSSAVLSVSFLVLFLFVASLQNSTCDLLSEAKYAEKMRTVPDHGPALLTYVWFGMQAGGLVAVGMSGAIIHNFSPKVPFVIAAIPSFAVFAAVLAGFLEESKVTEAALAEKRAFFREQKEACILCIVMLICSFILIITGLTFQSPVANGIVAIIVFFVVLFGFSVMLTPLIAKFNAYSLIQASLSWSIGGAAYFFYTDNEEQYPEGPHFSEYFFNSVMGVIGSIVSLVGIITYQRFFSNWSYRTLLVVANVALSFFSLLDIVVFTRTNIKMGIGDRTFVLGSSVLAQIIYQWQWMPQVVILSYLCPKGMEATMYALLAGCHNLGNTIASSCGALLLHGLNVKPSGATAESKMFENLWVASLCSTVLPLATIVLLFKLIPPATQTSNLVQGDATTGSLWRRWQGRDD